MPRPPRCRMIGGFPDYWSFAPDEAGAAEPVRLSLDEYETIRLIDHDSLTQEQCAAQMGVARTTVTAIYESARRKLAAVLVEGRRLQIGGGSYRLRAQESASVKQKGTNSMRIAIPYENGQIFQHFGHTEQFKLYDVEDGRIVASQVVDTNGSGHGALAGFLHGGQVDALICGGIGMGARNALAEAGIRLYAGVQGSADAAAEALASDCLRYDPNAHCTHHDHGEGHDCGEAHDCGGHSHGDGHGCGGGKCGH